MTWLDELIESTKEAETPEKFIYWAGLSTLSAVVKKNVFFRKNIYNVYPNIYVMLVGRSGTRKSFATHITKSLVEASGSNRIISGMNSIEAILDNLAKTKTSENGGPPATDATALISSNEFTNLMLDNPQALNILTELYDTQYNAKWDKKLKSGEIHLKNVCITFIAASNQAHFNSKIKMTDILGGFIGRTFVVLENEITKINALVRAGGKQYNQDDLVPYLKKLASLKGEFKFDQESTIVMYENWYHEFRSMTKDDDTGYVERMQDFALKLAMLLSLSEKEELILTEKNIEDALALCLSLPKNIKNITAGVGISDISGGMAIFVDCLLNAEDNKMERSRILQRNFQHFDVHVMARIVETLHQAGVIEVLSSGNKTYYRLTNLALEKMGK